MLNSDFKSRGGLMGLLKKIILPLLFAGVFAGISFAQSENNFYVSSESSLRSALGRNGATTIVFTTNSVTLTSNLPYRYNGKEFTFQSNVNTEHSPRVISGNGVYSGLVFTTYSYIYFAGEYNEKDDKFNYGISLEDFRGDNGGALYLMDSTAVGEVFTLKNNEANNGGAVYLTSGSYLSGYRVVAKDNYASSAGGVVYLASSTFQTGTSSFSYNTAVVKGGVLYSTRSIVYIDSSDVFSNTSLGAGGAFYFEKSTFSVYASSFITNLASNDGGAIYIDNSWGDIGYTRFSSNTAVNGIVYVSSSRNISFTSNTFYDNKITNGALYATTSSVNMWLTYLISNTATGYGGGAYFEDAKVNAARSWAYANSANLGGVFYADSSEMTLSSSSFTGNTAQSGGAAYIKDSSVTISQLSFDSNIAGQSGGAFFLDNSSADLSEFSFTGNQAANGAAMYIKDSGVTLHSGIFSNNSASQNGGAVYLTGSSASSLAELTLVGSDSGDIVFSGNTASGNSNDIYLDSNSRLNLDAGKRNITVTGGISDNASGTNIVINKTGSYNLQIGGISDINSTFNLNSGSLVVLNDAVFKIKNLDVIANTKFTIERRTDIAVSGTLNIAKGGQLSTDAVNSFYADTLNIDGYLKLGVDLTKNKTDAINGGNINLNSATSTIGFGGNLFKGGVASFKIMQATSSLSGTFNAPSGNFGARTSWALTYGGSNDVYVDLTVLGYDELTGFTHNQQQMANVIHKEYNNAYDTDNSFWRNVVSPMDALEMQDLKDTLDMVSGAFYSNLLMLPAVNSARNNFFGQIRTKEDKDDNVWSYVFGNVINMKKDENYIGDLEDKSWGVKGGWDIYNNVNVVGGLMTGFTYHDIEQKYDRAKIYDFNMGAYGGFIKEKYEIKSALTFGLQSYEARRDIVTIAQSAQGNFSAASVNFDVRAAYKVPLSEAIVFNPFAEFGAGFSKNDSFKEKGSGAELEVDSNDYLRTNVIGGIGFKGTHSDLRWYADAGAGCLLSGDQNEIEVKFIQQLSDSVKIKSMKQGDVNLNIGAGAEFSLTRVFDMFANIGYSAADGYDNAYANVGLRCRFSYWLYKDAD